MVAKKTGQGNSRKSSNTNRRSQKKGNSFIAPLAEAVDVRGADLKKNFQKLKKGSLPIFLASGVGAYFLVRFAIRYYKNHPEISDFVRENIDTVESKLREYRGDINSDEYEARH